MGKQEQKYRIGRHHHHKARKHLWLVILGLLMVSLGIGIFFIVRALGESNTEISMPEPITREYAPPQSNKQTFDTTEFTIQLPEDWRLKDHQKNETQNIYIFQATQKNRDNRWLEISVDTLPLEQPYNRLLPVNVDNNKIIVIASVSDNCTNFTGPVGANRPTQTGEDKLVSKWQGVSFMCDMANYTRNVVGVATAVHGSKLPLTGPKTGKHIFYAVYIDHNINPDYQILENAIESLTVK